MSSPILSVSLLLLSLLLSFSSLTSASRFHCGVCEAIVDEVNAAIASHSNKNTVQTRFRIDEKKHIPYARTEHAILEILEDDAFAKKFEKYSVRKPYSKEANQLRRDHKARVESGAADVQPLPLTVQYGHWEVLVESEVDEQKKEEVKTEETTAATPATTDADAAAAATPATDSAAATASDATTTPTSGETNTTTPPKKSTLLSTPSIRSEIKDAVSEFLDEHLDEAMLMFHKDVPDIKRRLCFETTEVCKPKKNNKKKGANGGKKQKDEL